jgi:hypothetical protein
MTALAATVAISPFEVRQIGQAVLSGGEPFLELEKGQAIESLLHNI